MHRSLLEKWHLYCPKVLCTGVGVGQWDITFFFFCLFPVSSFKVFNIISFGCIYFKETIIFLINVIFREFSKLNNFTRYVVAIQNHLTEHKKGGYSVLEKI